MMNLLHVKINQYLLDYFLLFNKNNEKFNSRIVKILPLSNNVNACILLSLQTLVVSYVTYNLSNSTNRWGIAIFDGVDLTCSKCNFEVKLLTGICFYSSMCCMLAGSEEERVTRRVSYLKATWPDRMNVDSDPDVSDSEPPVRSVANLILLYHCCRWCHGPRSGDLPFPVKINFDFIRSARDIEAKMLMSLTWEDFQILSNDSSPFVSIGETANKLVEWVLGSGPPL